MIFGYILAGLGFLFGLGGIGTTQFEHRAANDIRRSLTGDHVQVHIETRAVGLDALNGHLKRVTILATNFATSGLPLFTDPKLPKSGKVDELRIVLHNFDLKGLHIEELSSTIPDCRYDFGLALRKNRIRLSESGVGSGTVLISESDLEHFIVAKYKQIKTVNVKIADGKVHVWGFGEFIIIRTNFDVVAHLASPNGNTLVLSDADITFDGRPADEQSRKTLLDVLNPVVDLNRDLGLYGAISVTKIELANGMLRAEGATRIPVRPGS
jgi:hypothetical protein